jgi:hypothetical protein
MNLDIVPYQHEHEEAWDQFVLNESVNGTVFHTRTFLNYHPNDRFTDTSIVLLDGGKIVCVVPACEDENGSFSHAGSSYGGPVMHPDYYRVKRLSKIIDRILDYYENGLEMRLAPSIFGDRLNDPIVYMIGRSHRVVRELSVYKDLCVDGGLIDSFRRNSTRSAVRKHLREGFTTTTSSEDEDYREFHDLVVDNLAFHDEVPTHNQSELLDLKRRLGDHQTLVVGRDPDGRMMASTWLVKASPTAWHTFYIAKDYENSDHAAVPCILLKAMELAREGGANHLNFGICTEESGQTMNVGLFDFKESLGGETINRYQLLLDE